MSNATRINKTEAVEALRRAAWEEPVEATYAPAMVAGMPLYLHTCGMTEQHATPPDHGGCDACESGSDDPGDWRPLYVDTTPKPRRVIHSMRGGLGADWDLDGAIAAVESAREVAWVDHLLGHNLAVREADGRIVHFEVKRPAPVAEPADNPEGH